MQQVYISRTVVEQFDLKPAHTIIIGQCSDCDTYGHICDVPVDVPCRVCGGTDIQAQTGVATALRLHGGGVVLLPTRNSSSDTESSLIARKLKKCIAYFGINYVTERILAPTAASNCYRNKWMDSSDYRNGTYANIFIDGSIELLYNLRERLITIGYATYPGGVTDDMFARMIEAVTG